MIYVPTGKLEPDMVLAAPVRHPSIDDLMLLQTGYHLEARIIPHLEQLAVRGAWIHHPNFEFLDASLGNRIPSCRVKLYESVKRCFGGVADKTVGSFDPMEYRTVVSDMIMTLIANKDNAIWAERIMDGDNQLFVHCSNVAYLSLVIGLQIKEYILAERKFVNYADGTDLSNLGIGAMLHDLGKLGLAREWQDVHFLDPQAEEAEYREHTERGYRAVQGRIEATATQVLLHHHQRFDGTGFPEPKAPSQKRAVKRMEGRNIHIFSRVVSVANAIDTVIEDHKKRGLPMVAALASLKRPACDGMFDPIVLRAAFRVVPPFPLGTHVQLSDGRQAIVTNLNKSQPCQPTVTLLHNIPVQNTHANEEVDLSVVGSPTIARIGDLDVDANDYYV